MTRSNRATTLAASSRLQPEVFPPSLRCEPDTAWQRWLFWLLAPTPQDSAPPVNRLPQVQVDFLATLSDLQSSDADGLRARIRDGRSLRDLWHARAEVFRVVGVARGQAEAEQRLQRLNRHFPTRAPRLQPLAL
ncbi:MAG: hypothetical protein ABIN96_11270 [Rubrivivax sp.]